MNQVYSKKPPSPYAALQKSRWKTYGKVTHQLHQLSLIPSIWNRLHERKKKKIEIYGIKHMEHPSPHISTQQYVFTKAFSIHIYYGWFLHSYFLRLFLYCFNLSVVDILQLVNWYNISIYDKENTMFYIKKQHGRFLLNICMSTRMHWTLLPIPPPHPHSLTK